MLRRPHDIVASRRVVKRGLLVTCRGGVSWEGGVGGFILFVYVASVRGSLDGAISRKSLVGGTRVPGREWGAVVASCGGMHVV